MNPQVTDVQNAPPTVANTNTAITASIMVKARRLLFPLLNRALNFIGPKTATLSLQNQLSIRFLLHPNNASHSKPHLPACHYNDSIQSLRNHAELKSSLSENPHPDYQCNRLASKVMQNPGESLIRRKTSARLKTAGERKLKTSAFNFQLSTS
jgi:hypothetical protein